MSHHEYQMSPGMTGFIRLLHDKRIRGEGTCPMSVRSAPAGSVQGMV
jgi:hypothetical protein